MKRIKGRARNGVGEDSGANVHITAAVSMASTVSVGFGVQVGGVETGEGR